MGTRTVVFALVIVAGLTWFGLLAFMNRRPPDLANMLVFLLIWGGAVSSTAIPLAHATMGRFPTTLGRRRDLNRAIRRGLLVGILAIALMGLRMARLLTVVKAIVLALIIVSIEVLAATQRR
jgi:VanZ family protein